MAKKSSDNGSLLEIHMDVEKETKNTIRFSEDVSDSAPTIRTLYLPKHIAKDNQRIKVVVSAV